ncbi:hypothetical protein [Phocaeicola sp.]|uniref:hypothetical protein n=1 Tax=Phocaeicola sp. TaxID=2773926 RepID=UPI003A903829
MKKISTDLHFHVILTECQNALKKNPFFQCAFHVSRKETVCFPVGNRISLSRETYVLGQGGIKIKPVFPGKQDSVFPLLSASLKKRFFFVSLKPGFI